MVDLKVNEPINIFYDRIETIRNGVLNAYNLENPNDEKFNEDIYSKFDKLMVETENIPIRNKNVKLNLIIGEKRIFLMFKNKIIDDVKNNVIKGYEIQPNVILYDIRSKAFKESLYKKLNISKDDISDLHTVWACQCGEDPCYSGLLNILNGAILAIVFSGNRMNKKPKVVPFSESEPLNRDETFNKDEITIKDE